MTRPSLPCLVGAISIGLIACVGRQEGAQPVLAWQAAGIDYVQDWSGESIPARRIEVTVGSRHDTISMVLDPPLISVGDTLLLGFGGDSASDARHLFSFGARDRTLHTYSFPADVAYNFHDVAIAPNGQHWLYLAYDSSTYTDHLVVRVWPDGELVVRSDSVPMCDCDVDRHHAHWVTADSFELATVIGKVEWQRVAGSVSRRRVAVDTVPGPIDWH